MSHLPLRAALTFVLLSLLADACFAVSYASGVRNTGGTNYEFVLNADAANVVIKRSGEADLSMGALTPGRYSFDLGSATAFDIEVSSNFAAGELLSSSSNLFNSFSRPAGVAVNSDPANAYFGTVYVSSGDNQTSFAGRTTISGIYPMTADRQGVDLSDFSVVTDTARTDYVGFDPSWQSLEASTSSPWQIALDDGGNVIIADWSDANGGIKYLSPDFSTGGLVLAGEGDTNSTTHDSIIGRPYATGEVGSVSNPLTVWALDESLASPTSALPPSLWRWDVGSATASTVSEEIWIDTGAIPTASNGKPNFLQFQGIRVNSDYSPVTDKWYLTELRSDGNEAGLVILSADGNTQTLEWSSLDKTLELGLDGQIGQQLEDDPATPDFDESTLIIDTDVQDIIRASGAPVVSDDGRTLYLIRANQDGGATPVDGSPGVVFNDGNRYLGSDSNTPGRILVIPLDENGIPIIEVDDNGTPGEVFDDQITNWSSIETPNDGGAAFRVAIDLDAAGNVYITDDNTNANGDGLDVFSAGGAKKTTYSNTAALDAGSFLVEELVLIDGDYNADGVVNAADYTLWRDGSLLADGNGNGVVDGPEAGPGNDYEIWATNYGQVAAPSLAVPEPTAALLALAGLLAGVARRT